MLTHLQALGTIRSNSLQELGKQVVLVVPWVVLVKLSALLELATAKVKWRVVKAVEFIRDSIASDHPHIIFQTLDEVRSTFKLQDFVEYVTVCSILLVVA